MGSRFDLEAVRAFLVKTVSEHREIEGVSLEAPTVAARWIMRVSDYHYRIRLGEWVLVDRLQGDECSLDFESKDGRTVTLKIRRLNRSAFQLLSVDVGFVARTKMGS